MHLMVVRARLLMLALLLVGTLSAFASDESAPEAAHSLPPIFRALDFEAAVQAAQAEGKLLIVDGMTTWCSPCKRMDRTTWRDEKVVAWIKEHAIAIQVDMEAHEDVKDELGVHAFPTIVVLKDGVEVERVVGGRDAAFMLEWLELLYQGKTRRQVVREKAEALRRERGEDLTVAERLGMLAQLAEVEDGAASEECVWLWKHVASWAKDARSRDRYRLLGATRPLARRHAPTRAALSDVRDTLAPGAPAASLLDWYWLNQILEDDARTASWAREAVVTDEGRKQLRELGDVAYDALLRQGAWRAAGTCVGDAQRKVRLYANWKKPGAMMPMLHAPRPRPGGNPRTPKARDPSLSSEDRLGRQAEDELSDLYAALLAAGRTEEAAEVASGLLEHFDTPRARTALVAKTLEAGCFDARPEAHRTWLDEAIR